MLLFVLHIQNKKAKAMEKVAAERVEQCGCQPFSFLGVFLLVRSIIWELGCPAGFPFALLITVNPAASTAAPVSFS